MYKILLVTVLAMSIMGCSNLGFKWNAPEWVDQIAHVGVSAGVVCGAVKKGDMSVEDAQYLMYEAALLREKAQHVPESRTEPFEVWCDEGCKRDLEYVKRGAALAEVCTLEGK